MIIGPCYPGKGDRATRGKMATQQIRPRSNARKRSKLPSDWLAILLNGNRAICSILCNFVKKNNVMTVTELRKRLIRKINESENNEILEEMYRMIANEEIETGIYLLSNDQKRAVEESQAQFKNGQFLTGEAADKEIDEWLGK